MKKKERILKAFYVLWSLLLLMLLCFVHMSICSFWAGMWRQCIKVLVGFVLVHFDWLWAGKNLRIQFSCPKDI